MTETPSPGTVLTRISGRLPYLPHSLRLVGETVLRSPETARSMTITELAEAAGVGESTVSRFVKEIGFDGYKSMAMGLAEASFASRRAETDDGLEVSEAVYQGIHRGDTPTAIVRKIQHSSMQALRRTAGRQDLETIDRAVGLIEEARTLIFCCMGSSSIAAEDAVMRFTRAGKKCMLYRDTTIQVMLASVAGDGDLLIGISDSGQSTPVIEALRVGRGRGAATIAITSDESAPLREHADIVLYTSNAPTGGELYGESVTSKWGQLMVIDILYAAYAARHYDETIAHLKRTYLSAIRQSRAEPTA